MKFSALLIATGLGTCFFPSVAQGMSFNDVYKGVYFVGDSTVDGGRLYKQTGNTFPPKPFYHQGHFSNGQVWSEYFPEKLGLTYKAKNNFAYGGAGTGDFHLLPSFQGIAGVRQQVSDLIGSDGKVKKNALYVISAGANDYLYQGTTDVVGVVGNLLEAITRLNQAGARHFLISNLPDLSDLPLFATFSPEQKAGVSQLIAAHNSVLNFGLNTLESSTRKINLNLLDLNTAFTSVLNNPAAYGLTNVTDACLNVHVAQLPTSNAPTACNNPDEYLLWDQTHASTKTHALIADIAVSSMGIPPTEAAPEPLTLLGAGTAIGFGAFFKRKLSKKAKNDQEAA